MGGAKLTKVRGSCLDVAVIVLHSTVKQLLQLLPRQQPHRGTAFDVCLLLDGSHGVGDLTHLLIGYTLTTGHQRKTADALLTVIYRMAHTLRRRE